MDLALPMIHDLVMEFAGIIDFKEVHIELFVRISVVSVHKSAERSNF